MTTAIRSRRRGAALVIVLTAVSANRARSTRSVATTTYADGSHTATEGRTETDPPAGY